MKIRFGRLKKEKPCDELSKKHQPGHQELAQRARIPQSNISAMEKGVRPIGLKSAKKLARILHCNYKKLV
jgi:transcriptional regulator with XRE-family HTH domain